jgi:hypothetical protein
MAMFGTYRRKQQLMHRLPFGQTADNGPLANAFAHLPRREQLIATSGIVRGQLPNHNPAHEKLPALAGEWFTRHDAGYDINNWYTATTKSGAAHA